MFRWQKLSELPAGDRPCQNYGEDDKSDDQRVVHDWLPTARHSERRFLRRVHFPQAAEEFRTGERERYLPANLIRTSSRHRQ
jgi:hypothetical protein